MKPATTRRDFLATTSLALAGVALTTRGLSAQILPANMGVSSVRANDLMPEPLAPVDLKALALEAIDAAKEAGASYADVRVAESNQLDITLFANDAATGIQVWFSYGIRVLVEGTWAFVHGNVPSMDQVAQAARNAVIMGRGYSRLTTRRVELAPTPVAKGEWSTPFKIDPFVVPLQDQAALLSAFSQAAGRVRNGGFGYPNFRWVRETRVFASTEGALATQIRRWSNPNIKVGADYGMGDYGRGGVETRIPGTQTTTGGYETVMDPRLQDTIKRETENIGRIAALPRGTLDVGRYPAVFDGRTMGMVIGRTLGSALECDRMLGEEAAASGTSPLSPSADVLGTQVINPLLTVTGDRTAPTAVAVKWDDEGVEPQRVPVIQQGVLVDYFTSRSTVSSLQSWYDRRRQSVHSNGCAVAAEASDPVTIRPPHLTVSPGTDLTTVEDLCKNMTHGILLLGADLYSVSDNLTSGFIGGLDRPIILEVKGGRPVRRLENNVLQLNTSRLWKSLTALGDTRTMDEHTFDVNKGMPWRPYTQSVTAPAAFFNSVDVAAIPSRLWI